MRSEGNRILSVMRNSMACPRSRKSPFGTTGAGPTLPDLLLHQIDPGHFFGHRMLDLNAGVHFHEIELPILKRNSIGPGVDVVTA